MKHTSEYEHVYKGTLTRMPFGNEWLFEDGKHCTRANSLPELEAKLRAKASGRPALKVIDGGRK